VAEVRTHYWLIVHSFICTKDKYLVKKDFIIFCMSLNFYYGIKCIKLLSVFVVYILCRSAGENLSIVTWL
jgi:hypothetical protein